MVSCGLKGTHMISDSTQMGCDLKTMINWSKGAKIVPNIPHTLHHQHPPGLSAGGWLGRAVDAFYLQPQQNLTYTSVQPLFFCLQLMSFGDSVFTDLRSWLTGVKPDVVLLPIQIKVKCVVVL